MVKILEIKKLKRLYKLTLDDFVSPDEDTEPTDKLYITEDTIVKFRLTKGLDLSADEITAVSQYANFSRAKGLALYYLSFKTRTAAEVVSYLGEHEVTTAYIERAIKELTELRLINDDAYAESFVRGRVLAEKYGPYTIQQKLLQKGIARDLIQQKLTEVYPEEQQIASATKLAKKLAQAKFDRLPLKMLKLKIQQSLVSKGFSFSIAAIALDELALEADEENEQSLVSQEADKAYNRFSKRYEGYELKQRVSQALARKGFDWDDISATLRNFDF
jgi:regulatory protein